VSENALHCHDPTGVLLARAINYSHSAAPDLFQNFVMTETPLRVGDVRFRKDAFERFAGALAFGFESLAQETVNADSMIQLGYRSARRTSCWMLGYIRNRTRWRNRLVH